MPLDVKSGHLVTSTASETELNLLALQIRNNNQIPAVFIELVSGSVQFGVFAKGLSNQITASHRTYSTAGDKIIMTFLDKYSTVYCKGSGTFSITY